MRIASGLVLAAFITTPATADSSYEVRNGGQQISGSGLGIHTLAVSPGTAGTATLVGGASPVASASGTVAAGSSAFLRIEAIYRYRLSIGSVSASAGQALQQVFLTPYNPYAVIGQATGIFRIGGTANSDSEVSVTFSGNERSDNFYASCDGDHCYAPGGATAGIDTPYSVTLHMGDFSYCLFNPGCTVVSGGPESEVELIARAGVGVTSDSNGNPIGGSVFSMIDPTVTLDQQFFIDNGLNPNDYNVQLLTGGVPEPASWALLISAFAMVGAAARRRRRQPIAA